MNEEMTQSREKAETAGPFGSQEAKGRSCYKEDGAAPENATERSRVMRPKR